MKCLHCNRAASAQNLFYPSHQQLLQIVNIVEASTTFDLMLRLAHILMMSKGTRAEQRNRTSNKSMEVGQKFKQIENWISQFQRFSFCPCAAFYFHGTSSLSQLSLLSFVPHEMFTFKRDALFPPQQNLNIIIIANRYVAMNFNLCQRSSSSSTRLWANYFLLCYYTLSI